MFIFKSFVAFSLLLSTIPGDDWVSVPRPQRVPYQLEEEDRSIWVVFAKSFGEERILIRFPDDPIYQRKNGNFIAAAPYAGRGEFTLIVQKKAQQGEAGVMRDFAYPDPDQPGYWTRERHIESSENLYVLRFFYPSNNAALFSQFADSFEIERNSDFRR